MATPTLIYCASGNKRLAIDTDFEYGAQLPHTVYFKPYFVDQDWKHPNRERYMAALAKHKPHIASVLDLERREQLPEVLDWAKEAARYVRVVMIIPKVIPSLPRQVGNVQVRLGYSVPTKHGATLVPTWEFLGWPVHLLGGSPHKQMKMCGIYLDCRDSTPQMNLGVDRLNIVSIDGNMAVQHCQFWVHGTAWYARNRYWPTLFEADGQRWGDDAPYEAFRRSCQNIMEVWKRCG